MTIIQYLAATWLLIVMAYLIWVAYRDTPSRQLLLWFLQGVGIALLLIATGASIGILLPQP